MSKLPTNKADYDLDKYALFKVKDTGEPILIDIKESDRITSLAIKYRDIEKIPEEETVEIYIMEVDKTDNKFKLLNKEPKKVSIASLNFDWLEVRGKGNLSDDDRIKEIFG